jgi:hypothetical protein
VLALQGRKGEEGWIVGKWRMERGGWKEDSEDDRRWYMAFQVRMLEEEKNSRNGKRMSAVFIIDGTTATDNIQTKVHFILLWPFFDILVG